MRKNAKTNVVDIQPTWSITNVRWGATRHEALGTSVWELTK